MKTIIKLCDLSRVEILFRYQEDYLHKTLLGGFLSIILGILSIILISVFGSNMFQKLNPSVLSDTIVNVDNSTVNLNDDLFNIIIQFRHLETINGTSTDIYSYNSSLLNFAVWKADYILHTNGTKEQKSEKLALKVCDLKDFNSVHKDFFMSNSFNSTRVGYCLEDKNILLKGQYSSANFTFLKIQVSSCNGFDDLTDKEVQCEELDKINSIISNYKLGLFITYATPLYNNYLKPFSEQILSIGYNFNPNLQSKDNFFFSENKMITDDSWFYSSFDNVWDYTNYINTQTNTATTPDAYVKAYIRVGTSYMVSKRTYQKFQDILAQMLSIIQILFVLLQSFLNYFNRVSLNTSLINQYFTKNIDEKKIIKLIKEINKSLSDVELTNLNTPNLAKSKNSSDRSIINNSFNKIVYSGKQNVKNLSEIKPVLRLNQRTLIPLQKKISNKPYIPIFVSYLCFCKKDKRTQIFNILNDRLDSKMSVTTYLDNLEEMRYLKTLIFNKTQLNLLDILIKYHGNHETTEWLKNDIKDEKLISNSLRAFFEFPPERRSKRDKIFFKLLNKIGLLSNKNNEL